jgi:hypothetical protein
MLTEVQKNILAKKETATGKELQEILALEREIKKREKSKLNQLAEARKVASKNRKVAATAKKIESAAVAVIEEKQPVVKVDLYSIPTMVITDLMKHHAGLLSFVANALSCDLDSLKSFIAKNKKLKTLLLDIREANLDIVENVVLKRIKDEKSDQLAMFYLRNLGVQRGWNNEKVGVGGSSSKPLYIKILPVGPDGQEIKSSGKGRPKKIFSEIKVLPALPINSESMSSDA